MNVRTRYRMTTLFVALLVLAIVPWQGAHAQSRRTVYLPFVSRIGAPPPLPTGETVRWVGEFGGAPSAVAVRGEVGYLGEGHRLVVVDLSDPSKPKRLRDVGPFPGYVQDLMIEGGRIYVAAGEGGLRVMDLADPFMPREIGALDTPGDARAVWVGGSVAYLADGPGGLRVIDVADPARPGQVGHLDTHQGANALAIQDLKAYVAVADERSAGLVVVDVADPTRPRELGATPIGGQALRVAVTGAFAFVAAGAGGLLQVDVADPARPRVLSVMLDPQRVSDVLIHAGVAYAALLSGPEDFSLIAMADLADPEALQWGGQTWMLGQVPDLAQDGGRLYAAAGVAGLTSLAIGVGPSVKLLGHLDAPGTWATDVAVAGKQAYTTDVSRLRLATSWKTHLRIIDVSDATGPLGLSQVVLPENLGGTVCADGARAYVPLGYQGMEMMDVTRPAAPTSVGRFTNGGSVGSTVLKGSLALLLDGHHQRLSILDLGPPSSARLPLELGGIALPGYPHRVAVLGDTAYVASNEPGALHAINIADPTRPERLGSVAIPFLPGLHGNLGSAAALAADGQFVYLLEAAGLLRIVDASDPSRMHQVAQLPVPPVTLDMAVAGSFVFLASDQSGLLVVDVSSPTAPRLVATVDTPGQASAVALAGSFAYLADGTGGLQIFQVATLHP